MLEGSTTNKTTLRTLLLLIWFENSPHSNQRLDKMIGPLTDHEGQSMKIPSFFNTHTRYPLKWIKSNKLSSSNSPSCCLAWPTSSGVSHTDSWRMGGLEENQHDHKLNIAVRWRPGDTSEKINRKLRTTDMLLSLRAILLSRQDDMIKWVRDWHNPNSLIEECTRK